MTSMTQPIHPVLERVARAMELHGITVSMVNAPFDSDEAAKGWQDLARAAIQELLDAETTYDMYDAGDEFVGAHGDNGNADKVFKAMLKPLLGDEGALPRSEEKPRQPVPGIYNEEQRAAGFVAKEVG